MTLQVSFKQRDPDFNQKFADLHHDGKESGDNIKYNFYRTLSLEDVVQYTLEDVDEFPVEFGRGGQTELEIGFPNMTVLTIDQGDIEDLKIAVSKGLIKKTLKMKRKERVYFYFYFKDRHDWQKIGETIYILDKDIPKQLFKK